MKKLFALAIIISTTLGAFAQGTAFTYQGRLNDGAAPAHGSYDLQFAIYDAASDGLMQAPFVTNSAAAVSNGLFTVTLDFGTGVFPGAPRWLDIGVRTNGGGAFTLLAPRQALTATPYALTAGNISGTVPSANLSGTYSSALTLNNAGNSFTGKGAGLTSLNASQLTSGTVPDAALSNAWKTTGNAGTTPGTHFLGTTDNQPLEFKVNGERALRIEPNTNGAPNVIAGSPRNFVGAGVVGATIAGGGAINYGGSTILTNSVLADFGVVSGGAQNQIRAGAGSSTIGGGDRNTIGVDAAVSFIGGGQFNQIHSNAANSVISGGNSNDIGTNSASSSIAGGFFNRVGNVSFGGVIGGGYYNTNADNSPGGHIGGGIRNNLADNSSYGVISGGSNNLVGAYSHLSTLGGGGQNSIGTNSYGSAVGGGQNNVISNNAFNSTIGGGLVNLASGYASTVAGGARNQATGRSSTVGGGGDVADVFFPGNYASGDYSTVAGGLGNRAAGLHATVGGGNANNASSSKATVAGGFQNSATNSFATVPGGDNNLAGGANSFAAGHRAKANHTGAFVWGDSTEADFASTAAKQFLIRAGGGVGINTSNPVVSLTVEGSGAFNSIGAAAIAVRNPTANKTWEWHVLDNGRMQFADLGVGATRMIIDTSGNVTAMSFTGTSDRNAKENFSPVNAQDVLAKVAALPISQWNFKADAAVQHVGPMAQDFRAAFGLGPDDKHIATVDADGVALAAIQGLNQKLETQGAELKARDAELKKLQASVEELRQLVLQQGRSK